LMAPPVENGAHEAFSKSLAPPAVGTVAPHRVPSPSENRSSTEDRPSGRPVPVPPVPAPPAGPAEPAGPADPGVAPSPEFFHAIDRQARSLTLLCPRRPIRFASGGLQYVGDPDDGARPRPGRVFVVTHGARPLPGTDDPTWKLAESLSRSAGRAEEVWYLDWSAYATGRLDRHGYPWIHEPAVGARLALERALPLAVIALAPCPLAAFVLFTSGPFLIDELVEAVEASTEPHGGLEELLIGAASEYESSRIARQIGAGLANWLDVVGEQPAEIVFVTSGTGFWTAAGFAEGLRDRGTARRVALELIALQPFLALDDPRLDALFELDLPGAPTLREALPSRAGFRRVRMYVDPRGARSRGFDPERPFARALELSFGAEAFVEIAWADPELRYEIRGDVPRAGLAHVRFVARTGLALPLPFLDLDHVPTTRELLERGPAGAAHPSAVFRYLDADGQALAGEPRAWNDWPVEWYRSTVEVSASPRSVFDRAEDYAQVGWSSDRPSASRRDRAPARGRRVLPLP
jgi:hypothetical protein